MQVRITIPHHSNFVPQNFLHQYLMPLSEMKKHIDFGSDKIFEIKKYPVLKAAASRFVVDLNRQRDNTNSDQGVIITKAWDGTTVLKKKLSAQEIEERLVMYYDPFYKQLEPWLKPGVFLLDGHSMDSHGSAAAQDANEKRPEIDIATDFGKTCRKEVIEIFKKGFESAGFFVAKDTPYSGSRAKIIHLAKERGADAMELEINKKVFMNEQTFKLNAKKIEELKKIVSNCLKKVENLG